MSLFTPLHVSKTIVHIIRGSNFFITQHLASSHSAGGRPMHRCCVIQFWPPDDEYNCARNM